jgi:hypothetical protein
MSEPYGDVFKVFFENNVAEVFFDEIDYDITRSFHRSLRRVFEKYKYRPSSSLEYLVWRRNDELSNIDRTVLENIYVIDANEPIDPLNPAVIPDPDYSKVPPKETVVRQFLIRTDSSNLNFEILYAPQGGINFNNINDDNLLTAVPSISPVRSFGTDDHYFPANRDLQIGTSRSIDYYYLIMYEDAISLVFPSEPDKYGREVGWEEIIHAGNVFYPVESSDDSSISMARRPDEAIIDEQLNNSDYDPPYPRTQKYRIMGDAVLLGSLSDAIKQDDKYQRWWLSNQNYTNPSRITSMIKPIKTLDNFKGSVVRTGFNQWQEIRRQKQTGTGYNLRITKSPYYDLWHAGKQQYPINNFEIVDRILPIPFSGRFTGLLGFSKYIRTFSSIIPHGGLLLSENNDSKQAWHSFAPQTLPSNYVALWNKIQASDVPKPAIATARAISKMTLGLRFKTQFSSTSDWIIGFGSSSSSSIESVATSMNLNFSSKSSMLLDGSPIII